LEETPCDPIANGEAGHVIAYGNDLARTIGKGDEGQGLFGIVVAFNHEQVAVIDRGRFYLDDHLARTGDGVWSLDNL
jgi:hypothetical protein